MLICVVGHLELRISLAGTQAIRVGVMGTWYSLSDRSLAVMLSEMGAQDVDLIQLLLWTKAHDTCNLLAGWLGSEKDGVRRLSHATRRHRACQTAETSIPFSFTHSRRGRSRILPTL